MATAPYPHIEITADGTVLVEGTRTKVVEIALDRLAHHWDAEEIQRQHPHLTLGQIYAALTYYHDHRQHFDSEMTFSPFPDPSGMLGFRPLTSLERVGFRWAESTTRKSRLRSR